MNLHKQKKEKIALILLIAALGFFSRLLPHAANFTPVGAIAIFGALYLPKRLAIILPLATMFCSDLFIGFYSWQVMLSVYLGFVIIGLLGLTVRTKYSFLKTLGASITGSIIFYLLTNAAVWYFGTLYSHDFSGLFQSYTMALPFFRNSLFGDIFYTTVLIGGVEVIKTMSLHKTKQLV